MPSRALHTGHLGLSQCANADGDQRESLLQRSLATASSLHVYPPPDLGNRRRGVDSVFDHVRSHCSDEPATGDQLRDVRHLGLSGSVATASP